jgi:DNA-binding NarL/FixJ family response regulator
MKRVIVIDDHAYVRETLVELLSNELGLTVVGSGADGAEAVELVGRLAPDVVVMDLQMAGTDGVEATREIVRRHGATRVVVLTATPHGQLASQALAAGAHACLAKSGRYSALVDAIRAA